jgi:uncharacterized transporter YbjL
MLIGLILAACRHHHVDAGKEQQFGRYAGSKCNSVMFVAAVEQLEKQMRPGDEQSLCRMMSHRWIAVYFIA